MYNCTSSLMLNSQFWLKVSEFASSLLTAVLMMHVSLLCLSVHCYEHHVLCNIVVLDTMGSVKVHDEAELKQLLLLLSIYEFVVCSMSVYIRCCISLSDPVHLPSKSSWWRTVYDCSNLTHSFTVIVIVCRFLVLRFILANHSPAWYLWKNNKCAK